MNWTLVIHGGCGAMRPDTVDAATEEAARAGLNAALDAGSAILATGGSALDAVEAAARGLEDDPSFNAGRGSVLTAAGHVELDAAMEHSPHVLLTYGEADAFAREQRLEQVANDWFITPQRKAQLDKVMASGGGFDVDIKYGTIGAVAVDSAGHVAAATSTGGLTAKRWGRIGDSPLIGAGTYADDRACAASATGLGEAFIRAVGCHQLAMRMMLAGEGLQEAIDAVLADVRSLGGTGGVIAVAPSGEAALGFTTPGMYRAIARADGNREVKVYDEASER